MAVVPYIANYLYENPLPDLNLKGIWMADPSLSWELVQESIPALRFVQVSPYFRSRHPHPSPGPRRVRN